MQIATIKTLTHALKLQPNQVWDIDKAYTHLKLLGEAKSKRTVERYLHQLNLLNTKINPEELIDEFGKSANKLVLRSLLSLARQKRQLVLFVRISSLPTGQSILQANDAKGTRYWLQLTKLNRNGVKLGLETLQQHIGKHLAIFSQGPLVGLCKGLDSTKNISIYTSYYEEIIQPDRKKTLNPKLITPHLKNLEAESIFILREVFSEAANPVILMTLGKNSSVLLHLVRKAFYPSPPPLALLHLDADFKTPLFKSLLDDLAKKNSIKLIKHYADLKEKGDNINLIEHRKITPVNNPKIQSLMHAIELHKFDVVFSGDLIKIQSPNERKKISFYNKVDKWNSNYQHPELWQLLNTTRDSKTTVYTSPLCSWTEVDVWQYIYQENIKVNPLYFSQKRPVIYRNNKMILVSKNKPKLLPHEKIIEKSVRFTRLNNYPWINAIESSAKNPAEIICELINMQNLTHDHSLLTEIS